MKRSSDSLIITLDGPAGSGKSAVARLLAAKLGMAFLDTGAMYRAVVALALDKKIDPTAQPGQLIHWVKQLTFHFDWHHDPPRLHMQVDGQQWNVANRLRSPEVTALVSPVAAMEPVRDVLVHAQREIGLAQQRLVTEGRDQGSVVFPDAPVKFYIEASPAIRAQRRAAQLRQAGQQVDTQHILQQIIQRDARDASRVAGPMICPADALRLDTSGLSLEQVVDQLFKHVQNHLAGATLSQGQADV